MSSLTNTISVTAGGIDVSSIVTGLMTAERVPLLKIQARQAAAQQQITSVASIKTDLEAVKTKAASIITNGLARYGATVSNTAAASVSLGTSARAGSASFTVDRLASAHGLRTSATVASSSTAITTASLLAVSTASTALGVTSIGVGSGTTAGSQTIKVTQATAGATVSGSSALAASTVINGSNNTLDLEVDGVARTITIAAGTYTRSGLATAVQSALDATGGGVTASVDASNRLQLTTTHEGSAATLAVPGGSALAALGVSITMPAKVGIDGSIQIGTNPAVTVTSAGKGEVVSVSTGSGTLDLTLGGGLRVGEAKAAVVSTGDRSLGAVASAINNAGVGATAAAVRTGDGAWLLQVNSAKTGSANALALDSSVFSLGGGLVETSSATDAKITLGSGAGAYSITASGNTFTDVLPGVSITAKALSASAVNVAIDRDDVAIADSVESLVTAANTALKNIATQTAYDSATGTAAPLATNAAMRGLGAQLRSAVTSLVGGGSTTLAADYGITSKKDGSLAFDRDVFLAKLSSDPAGAERLFARNGSASNAGVTYASATDSTVGGSYAVNITQAATRATTGTVLSGGSVAGQRIGVRVGTKTVSYDATAGSTAATIASGLNSALAQAGLNVTAEVDGAGVRLTSTKYGGSGSFESNLDVLGAGSWATSTGQDVKGTINGENAVGVGNRLSMLNLGTSPARGLAIDVGEGVTGAVGTVSYHPGVAARLTHLVSDLTSVFGGLTTTTATYESKVRGYNDQITKFEDRMTRLEANYRRQWTAVQTSLNSLQNQQDWLTKQISSLSNNNS